MSSKGKKSGYGGPDNYGSTGKGSKADGYGGSDSHGKKGSGKSHGSTSKGSKADGYGGSDSYGSNDRQAASNWQLYLRIKNLRPEAEMVAEAAEQVADRLQDIENVLESIIVGRPW